MNQWKKGSCVAASYVDSTQLLYLRARYYNPADGRFQSRDTWGGDENQSQSLNRWIYVVGNPINLTDPSGLNPNCVTPTRGGSSDYCAVQRLEEIIKENGSNGAKALVSLFKDSELQSKWGVYAGTTSAARLEWVLKVTLGSDKKYTKDLTYPASKIPGIHLQFGKLFPTSCSVEPNNPNCGCGILPELEDSQLYYDRWGGGVSRQINHFLSGVGEYYYGRDVRTIIAHEKSSDNAGFLGSENYFNEVTLQDYAHFYSAWRYDVYGMYAERDVELWAILNFDPKKFVNIGDADPARPGNSLQDFRLSLRSVRFADWIISNKSSDPSGAGEWLTTYLLP